MEKYNYIESEYDDSKNNSLKKNKNNILNKNNIIKKNKNKNKKSNHILEKNNIYADEDSLTESVNNIQRIYKNNIIVFGKRSIYPIEYQEKNLNRNFIGFKNLK